MDVKKAIGLAVILISLFPGIITGQTALRMPEILTRAEKRVSINCLLNKQGPQLNLPWVVYSDRDHGDDHFGSKYFVVAERETALHIYRAAGYNGRKLIAAKDMGWKSKSELLVSLGADFTENSLIHRKCVILNHHKTIERIKRGELSESEVPFYASSTGQTPVDFVPLYMIYFIYKIENNRYLLGKDYRFSPDLPFSEQIIGWVDRERVFDYSNRICFEPNYEETSVAYRRCNPKKEARVFEFESDLTRFLQGDTTQKSIWVEPDYYFFRNPRYTTDQQSLKEPIDLFEKNFSASLLKRLCSFDGNAIRIKESRLLTGRPLPGNKFRFPLIRMANLPDNMFVTGVAGRFEDDHKSRMLLCNALKTNKSQISVYFILDNTIDRNRLSYLIAQIQQEFGSFQKRFGACFFPRQQLGKYRVSLDEKVPGSGGNNYQYVRDFIRNYATGQTVEVRNDNVLSTLKFVLDNENFEPCQTNILVMVNNHDLLVQDAGLALLRNDIRHQIVEKNCYLLTFDYRNDNNLVRQIREISVAAGREYAVKLGISSGKIAFKQTNIGDELENAAILSIIAQSDSGRLAAAEMQTFLQAGYPRIVNAINSAIEKICMDDQQPANTAKQHEDPFQRALRDIPGIEGTVPYIRALEEGYAAIRDDQPGSENPGDTWKANVLMTKPELQALGSLLDKMVVQSNNSSFSKSVFDLWIALFNRFVGDNLVPADLLSMTPQAIMNRIVGEAYGYALADPVKRYTLEQILANDQEIQKYYDNYRLKLISCNNNIREILANGRLRFSLDEDAANANQASRRKGICYYWVPIDLLP